jgi:hypothetical protein
MTELMTELQLQMQRMETMVSTEQLLLKMVRTE